MTSLTRNAIEHPKVQELVDVVKTFAKREEAHGAFDTCGLYLVGSSLTSEEPNDIDITLVGLDFRALFRYDWVYLQEHQSLIENNIILPGGKNGDYDYNSTMCEGYDSIDTYCATKTTPSYFACKLLDRVFKSWDKRYNEFDADINPLQPYGEGEGSVLCIRGKSDPVDFIIHAENMLVNSWKEYQKKNNLPFVPLHEWGRVTEKDPGRRYISHPYPHPGFIDKNGLKRSS